MENTTNISLHNYAMRHSIRMFFRVSSMIDNVKPWPYMRLDHTFMEVDMLFVEIADELVRGFGNAAV